MTAVRTYDTEIAIVGSGGAGIAAGIEACDAGAAVVVFEKMRAAGGATILSGGGCCIVGSPLQEAQGIYDRPDAAFADWL